MPFSYFSRRSSRADEPSSPSRFSTIQVNVRALLAGSDSPQPAVVPSPTRPEANPTVETPKLPPLSFLQPRGDHSDLSLPFTRGSDEYRHQEPDRPRSQRSQRSRSQQSARTGLSRTERETPDVENQLYAHPLHSHPPCRSSLSEPQLRPYHPADTAAAEAQPHVSGTTPNVRPSTGHRRQHSSALVRVVSELGNNYNGPRSVDPETQQLVALVQKRGRRRRRKAFVRKKSARGKCCAFVHGGRARNKLALVVASGAMLGSVLTIYLSLALTRENLPQSLHVLFILAILGVTVFFCHALIRLCMLLLCPPYEDGAYDTERPRIPSVTGPEGFKPARPIRVHLARDDELTDETGPPAHSGSAPSSDASPNGSPAGSGRGSDGAGAGEKDVVPPPPAYGLWRSSVRVDPNLLHWAPALAHRHGHVRDSTAPPSAVSPGASPPASSSSGDHGSPDPHASVEGGQRPPSYVSDDGVEYVVGAEPRSTVEVVPDGMHPALRQ